MLSPSFVTLANSVTFSNAFASGFSTTKWGCMNTPLKFKVVCKGPSRLAVTMTAWGHPPHTGAPILLPHNCSHHQGEENTSP